MTIKLKENLSNFTAVDRAARRRIKEDTPDLAGKDLELAANKFLRNGQQSEQVNVRSGRPLFSTPFTSFLNDCRFYIGSYNGHLTDLQREIESSSQEAFSVLDEIQKEAKALDSTLSEEEIKVLNNFDFVHYNSFTRRIDSALGFDQQKWLVDFKTDLPFLQGMEANVIAGEGITLPIREITQIPIADAYLVGEETDVGDSRKPVESTSPRNLLLPNKVFRHVIIKRDYDSTTRKYKKFVPQVSVMLEFSNLQLLNMLSIEPVGHSTVDVFSITYVNEAGEEIALDVESISTELNTKLVFEPIRTKYLKLSFRQFAPVTSSFYNVENKRTKQINKILKGAGFSTLLEMSEDPMQGRVFDFSLKSISAGLVSYEPLGFFRSQDVNVSSPAGLVLNNVSESIKITSDQRGYGQDFDLPDGVVLSEYYVGVDFKNVNGGILLRDLIPLPDTSPVQSEALPLLGGKSKLKLLPDLLWNVERDLVKSIYFESGIGTDRGMIVELYEDHSYRVGDAIAILTPPGYNLGVSYVIKEFVDELTFITEPKSKDDDSEFGSSLTSTMLIGLDPVVDENTRPYTYIYDLGAVNSSPPLSVYRENQEIYIGSDYKISFDGGETFFTDWPNGDQLKTALEDPRSGRCIVELIKPEYDKFYWCEYKPMQNQWLGSTKLARLRGNKVIFDESLKFGTGTANTVVVLRADNNSPLVTPVIYSYSLKVRKFNES